MIKVETKDKGRGETMSRCHGIQRRRKLHISRLVLKLFLATLIPMLIIWTIWGMHNMRSRVAQTMEKQNAQLMLLSAGIESYLSHLESSALLLAQSGPVKSSLSLSNYNEEYIECAKLLDALQNEKYKLGHIRYCYYYNAAFDLVLSDHYGYVSCDQFSFSQHIDLLMQEGTRSGWRRLGDDLVYMQVLPALYAGKTEGLICYYVDEESLLDQYDQQFVLYPSGLTVYNNGEALLYAGTDAQGERVRQEEQKLLSGDQREAWVDGMLYTMQTQFARAYVLSAPLQSGNWSDWLSGTVVHLLPLSICIGFLLSALNAYRVESPVMELRSYALKAAGMDGAANRDKDELRLIQGAIRHMSEDMQAVNSYMARVKPTIRETVLQQLLNNTYLSNESFEEQREYSGFAMDAWYMVLAVESINESERYCDTPLKQHMLCKLLQEQLEGFCRVKGQGGQTLPGDQPSVATVVLFADKEMERSAFFNAAYEWARIACRTLAEQFETHIAVGFGQTYAKLTGIALSLSQARMILMRGDHAAELPLFVYADSCDFEAAPIIYPGQTENAILRALDSGDSAGVEEAFSNFVRQVSLRHTLFYSEGISTAADEDAGSAGRPQRGREPVDFDVRPERRIGRAEADRRFCGVLPGAGLSGLPAVFARRARRNAKRLCAARSALYSGAPCRRYAGFRRPFDGHQRLLSQPDLFQPVWLLLYRICDGAARGTRQAATGRLRQDARRTDRTAGGLFGAELHPRVSKTYRTDAQPVPSGKDCPGLAAGTAGGFRDAAPKTLSVGMMPFGLLTFLRSARGTEDEDTE